MLILVSGATKTMRLLPADAPVGVMFTPANSQHKAGGRWWAADNGSFKGFNEQRFVRMLDKLTRTPRCLFVTAPDVVADAKGTAALFRVWEPRLREYGWSVAFVLQDGVTVRDVPWESCECIFLGGSTGFKLSAAALTILAYAKALGKWVHVGRVNSRKRVEHFMHLADSIDGTSVSMYADTYLRARITQTQSGRRRCQPGMFP